MRLYFVYDPEVVTDPNSIVALLDADFIVIAKEGGVLADVEIPAAGYVVIANSWQGHTVYPGPLTHDDIVAIPDPGIDPDITRAEVIAAVRRAVREQTQDIDPADVTAAVARLEEIIATGSVQALPSSPTNADVVQQVRTLTTAVNLIADAVRDLARIEKGVINYLT